MNKDRDYSAAYVIARTDSEECEGYGFAFTIGRGNDVQLAAIREVARRFVGRDVSGVLDDLGEVWRELVHDSQLRWLGPEKGVMHMGIGAVINALRDLKASIAGVPLWRLLARMSPEEIVSLMDFRYVSDAMEPDEALDLLRAARKGSRERETSLIAGGFPAYASTPGWLGYSDDTLRTLCAQAAAAAKFGVPVCPHAGGVGLCEAVQHLAMWDYVAVSGTMQDRMIEWIDHLHDHFEHPASADDGRYRVPLHPGASTALRDESLKEYAFPDGRAWKELGRP